MAIIFLSKTSDEPRKFFARPKRENFNIITFGLSCIVAKILVATT